MFLAVVTCPFPKRSFDRGGVNVGEWDGPFSLLYSMHYSLLGCTNWTAIWISRNKKKKEVLPDAVVLLECETVGYILKASLCWFVPLPVTSAGRLKKWAGGGGRQTCVEDVSRVSTAFTGCQQITALPCSAWFKLCYILLS